MMTKPLKTMFYGDIFCEDFLVYGDTRLFKQVFILPSS